MKRKLLESDEFKTQKESFIFNIILPPKMAELPKPLETILHSEITLQPIETLKITTVTEPQSSVSTHTIGPTHLNERLDYTFSPNKLARFKVVELREVKGVCQIILSDGSHYQLHHNVATMPNVPFEEVPYTHYLGKMFLFM